MDDSGFPDDFPAGNLLRQMPLSLVITNPNLPDHPIVFVNGSFEQTTGYSREMAVGSNCRFLQGDDTRTTDVRKIRDAIEARRDIKITVRNYKANGDAFWNELNISPIYTGDGKLVYFLGIQREVSSRGDSVPAETSQDLMLREVQHRVKNHLSMVVSLIRTHLRQSDQVSADDFAKLARRVEALPLLYEQFRTDLGDFERIDIGAYAAQVTAAVTHLSSSKGVQVNVSTETTEVSVERAVHIGLILSEVLTNALQHAFEGRDRGRVDVALAVAEEPGGDVIKLAVSDDGVGFRPGQSWPNETGSGSIIVQGMITNADAEMLVSSSEEGTRISIDFPAA